MEKIPPRVIIEVRGSAGARLIEPADRQALHHSGISEAGHGHVGSRVCVLSEETKGHSGHLGPSTGHWVSSVVRFGILVLENESHGKKGRGFDGVKKGEKNQYHISLLIQAK